MGYQEPSGLSTGTGAHLGLAWKLRLLLGMTRSQGPSQGPSATASISATRRGRRLSMDKTDKTRYIKTVPEESTRQKNMSLGTWHGTPGWICELDPREHALGWSQRRTAGLPHELQAGLGELRTVACLGEPRTADLRRSRRTPTPKLSGLGQDYEQRVPCRGTDTQEQTKTFKSKKTNEVKGRRLLFWSYPAFNIRKCSVSHILVPGYMHTDLLVHLLLVHWLMNRFLLWIKKKNIQHNYCWPISKQMTHMVL